SPFSSGLKISHESASSALESGPALRCASSSDSSIGGEVPAERRGLADVQPEMARLSNSDKETNGMAFMLRPPAFFLDGHRSGNQRWRGREERAAPELFLTCDQCLEPF